MATRRASAEGKLRKIRLNQWPWQEERTTWVNKGRIRPFTSRSEDAQSSSVASIGNPVTVAITAISALVKKHTAMKARQILEVLAKANLSPVKDAHIKAAELLLTDPEYCEAFDPEDLTKEIETAGATAEHEAKVFAITHKVQFWKALASVWFKKTRKKRRAA